MLPLGRSHSFLICLLAAVLLGMVFSVVAEAGEPFGFSSSWNYRENGGETEGSSQFSDNYNLTYSKDLSAAMSFAGSVRYSQNRPSSGNDSYSLNPNLSFDLRNDLFSLNLNASQSESGQDGAPTRTTDSWGLNLNSQIEDWPSMRLYFNQSTSTDDSNPTQLDSESTTVGLSVDHSFEHVDLLYDVRVAESSDNIQNSTSDTLDQTAQISYDQSFFQGRFSVSASQQYQITENSSESFVGAGNTFFADTPALVGLFQVDNTPLGGELLTENALVDGDLSTSVGIDLFSTTALQNIGVWVNTATVDRLRLVLIDDQLTTAVDAADLQSRLSFTAYSSPDNIITSTWTPIPASAARFITENGRSVVVIDFLASVTRPYLKIVADASPPFSAPTILVSELEPQVELTATTNVVSTSRDTTNMQTQFSTSLRITDKWSVSYSLRRAENLQDSGDSVQFNHSLTSSYSLNEKVGFSVGISENTDEADNSPGRQSRSFSLAMSAQPLPTLSFSLGYTRSESESDDGQDTVSNSISSSLNATIYPDLTASMTGNLSQSENLAEGTETSSFGLTLNTTAYFTPKVDMNTILSYSESDSSGGETSRATSYGFTLGYRPSDMLLLNFSYDGEVEEGSSVFSGNSSWLWTKKLQSQFGLTYGFGDETSQQYNAVLSWLINRNLSLQSSGNYQIAEDGNSWSSNASLNMVF